MKGKIIIEAISQEVVDAECAANGWDTEKGTATGLSINIGMAATRAECVEVCYSLCKAFKLDVMEKVMLAMKLADMVPGETRRSYSVNGPLNGRKAEAGDAPPPLL